MNRRYKIFSLVLLLLFGLAESLSAQSSTVRGKVVDPNNEEIADVAIRVLNTDIESRTDASGSYSLSLPAGKVYRIQFKHVAFQSSILEIRLQDGVNYDRKIKMLPLQSDDVNIYGEKSATSIDDRNAMLVSPLKLDKVIEMPIAAPSLEYYTKFQPGVATTSEFSSQYQVRGGNFDENLVYVNGIEIYRPFLARSGQQEGLGFSNSAMAQGLNFSTGGFGAQYGDKLSSVLDITYRQPREFRATIEAGILSTNIHVEGISKNKKNPNDPGKFTYLMGARRFALSYLLNSLDTRGDYRPLFLDYQGMFTYTPKSQNYPIKIKERKDGTQDTVYYANEKLKFTSFVALSRNRYLLEPEGRVSTFGTIQQAFRVSVAFEGREISSYNTGLGALMLTHKPNTRLQFDYILTAFNTQETEFFDVEGGYLLGQVNTNFGSDEFNESDFDLGIGTQFQHGRNYLNASVISGQIKGRWTLDNETRHKFLFGVKGQRQVIDDDLKEYAALDSAGFLVDSIGRFGLDEYIRGKIQLNGELYKGYLQHEWQINKNLLLFTGGRVIYYDYRNDGQQKTNLLFSPRVQLLIKAKEEYDGETSLRFRLAGGLYQQPPFYREMRRFDGTLNLDIEAQESLHLIAGMDYRFSAWGRPFRLFSEAYYKRLDNLIPYEVQNVRLRYYPDEVAKGFAYGVDARINGEFIKGVDSWVSMGFLKTSEDLQGDEEGFVSRPTDQRFTFAMFFQDELPANPTFKVHVTYVYGSGMRFGPPRDLEDRTAFNFPAYQRADIGFSKLISFRTRAETNLKRGVESLWATLEIFNLFQRQNTVSHYWIKDLQNNQFAVPNFLSARLLNVRLVMKFR
ncbi:MAG: TonB-dependent receptor [Bacteroidota bacterium]